MPIHQSTYGDIIVKVVIDGATLYLYQDNHEYRNNSNDTLFEPF